MVSKLMRAAAIALLSCCLAGMAAGRPAEVTDDRGHRITLPGPATRVVSLSPALTELVFAAGGGSRLVGAVEYSDYPAAALGLPRIGDALALQMEKILTLQPDLIVAWERGNNPRQLERLSQLGVPIYYSDIEQLDDVASTLERLGVLLDTPAEAAARSFRERLARLGHIDAAPAQSAASAVSAQPPEAAPVRVLYQVWAQPLMTVNGRHVISNLIERCGGVNVFASEPALVPQIGIEAALAAAPEAIIASAGSRSVASDRSLEHWRRYPSIPAVARGFLFLVDGDSISRATPRMLDAGEAICRHLDKVRRAR
jgi:iron complex transport system substrate-binding protein